MVNKIVWGVKCTIEECNLINEEVEMIAKLMNITKGKALIEIIKVYSNNPQTVSINKSLLINEFNKLIIQANRQIEILKGVSK